MKLIQLVAWIQLIVGAMIAVFAVTPPYGYSSAAKAFVAAVVMVAATIAIVDDW